MRIKVHPGLCNGWGECHRWGREVYPLDEDGHCEMRLLEVPPEYEDHARLGAMACPEQAISIIDDDPEAARRFRIVPAGEVAVRLAAADGTGPAAQVLDPA